MKYRLVATLVFAISGAAPGALTPAVSAAPTETARVMYSRAMAEERVVRAESATPTLAQIHHAITSYEAIVRKHPASGYCDNALWQGGNLALLAFVRYGSDADQKKATRLFTMLIKEYPASKLAKSAREALAPGAAAAAAPSGSAAASSGAAAAPSAAAATSGTAALPFSGTATPSGSDLDARRAPESSTKTPPPYDSPKPRSDATPSGPTILKDVHRTELPDGIRVTVDLDTEVAYHQEEIPNPRRLFFDLKGVKAAPNLQDVTLRFDGDIVRLVRLGRHPQNTTRLVVDLDGVAGYSVYPLYSPYRLVIDLQRAAAPSPSAHDAGVSASAHDAGVSTSTHDPGMSAAKPFTAPPLKVSAKTPSAGTKISEIKLPAQPPPAPLPVVEVPSQPQIIPFETAPAPGTKLGDPATVPPLAPTANSNGKFSLSRQLGLGVSRIVIDAGHGGHDPGAHGSGINEAELTLDVALRLQKLLEKQPGFEVVMTRDTDEFIPLQERTAIANREGADLFLSIHANASRNPQARGIETYFLNFAMNPEAEAVAARENAASGQAMHSLPDIVKAIALNNKINESRDFATTVQKSMVKRLGTKNHTIKDLGVKQAPFVVLIGASMPSVLAEISFVTNKQDGSLLKTQAYRQQIAQALFEAIQNYQQALNRINPATGKKATDQ